MRNSLCKSMMVISIIIIPILFSYASAQHKHNESGDAKFYFKRGVTSFEKGQYDQAISDFTKAIEIDPGYAKARNNRGIAYLGKGQYDQAASDFTKAIEIDPRYAGAYYNRGRVYYLKKEYDKSWNDINKVQELGSKIPPEFLDDLRKASGREK